MGITPDEAVAKLYEAIAAHCELCLETGRVPNAETLAALREPPENHIIYASVDEMMAEFYGANPSHFSPPPTRLIMDG